MLGGTEKGGETAGRLEPTIGGVGKLISPAGYRCLYGILNTRNDIALACMHYLGKKGRTDEAINIKM